MPTIQVVKPFTLQLDPRTEEIPDPMDRTGEKKTTVTYPSERKFFDVGIYDVDDYTAGHWYVMAHLKGYVEPPKGPGTAEWQMAQARAPKKDENERDPSQPMPSDATAPRPAPIPAGVIRAEPIQ